MSKISSRNSSGNYLKYKNIYVIPTYHGRINFGWYVLRNFFEIKPDAVCVELPDGLKSPIIEGVKRLPRASLIILKDSLLDKYFYVPIMPGDSIIEGVRLALENKISFYFIDLNISSYSALQTALPDDEVIKDLGLEKFYKIVKYIPRNFFNLDEVKLKDLSEYFMDSDLLEDVFRDPQKETLLPRILNKIKKIMGVEEVSFDLFREYYMACNLKVLMEDHKKILLVIGLAHWESIKKFLEIDDQDKANNSKDPDSSILDLSILNYNPPIESFLYNVAPKDVFRFSVEVPYFIYQYENFREQILDPKVSKYNYKKYIKKEDINAFPEFSKNHYIKAIFYKAINEYKKRYRESLSYIKINQLHQYFRNLMHMDNRLTPELYHFVVSARGIVDDDFTWYTYKTAIYYPFAVAKDNKLPTLKVKNNQVLFKHKFIKIYRRLPGYNRKINIRLKKIKQQKAGENWQKDWQNNEYNIYSWPEEDVILENKYKYIRSVGHRLLEQRLTKVYEFKGSFMDGIDIRETIRNWIRDQKIFVKEIQPIKGNITNFVIVFDDEPLPFYLQPQNLSDDGEYPYSSLFLAEHEQESDLFFYSTKPGEILIGPGITLIKLGVLMSEFPPISFNSGVWNIFDPSYNKLFVKCTLKSERVLLGAIYLTQGKYILYIDNKRPKQYFYRMANIYRKKIVFIPISNFQYSTIERIRYMHLIAGKSRRKIAGDYIDLDRRFKF